jgi:hypothetical protein
MRFVRCVRPDSRAYVSHGAAKRASDHELSRFSTPCEACNSRLRQTLVLGLRFRPEKDYAHDGYSRRITYPAPEMRGSCRSPHINSSSSFRRLANPQHSQWPQHAYFHVRSIVLPQALVGDRNFFVCSSIALSRHHPHHIKPQSLLASVLTMPNRTTTATSQPWGAQHPGEL